MVRCTELVMLRYRLGVYGEVYRTCDVALKVKCIW